MKNPLSNKSASFDPNDANKPIWRVQPNQLVSLLDMIKYPLDHMFGVVNAWFDLGLDQSPTLEEFKEKLLWIEKEAKFLGLKQSTKMSNNIYQQLLRKGNGYKDRDHDAYALQRIIEQEMGEIVFGYIPLDKTNYYEQEQLFGPLVAANFPQAADDIREAGNCFALMRYTACIFHLMRTLEYGLRALAKNLHVKTPRPIQVEDWGNIINVIDKKINLIETTRKRTPKRQVDLAFYHGAASQFRHFKDAWRNHAMHTQASYDEEAAKIVMNHVCNFMQHIATRLKEK